MAVGTYTHIAASTAPGIRTVVFSLQLTSGANLTVEGDTLDLSSATRGAYRGFTTRVDGLEFLGWVSGSAPAANIGGFNFEYGRAANGAPATGVLKITGVGVAGAGNAAVQYEVFAVNTDLSALVGVFKATGV